MGGKTSTSSQQVSVPPQVLAQYSSVNAAANQTAQTPFQQYSGEFVAPVNSTQQTGIAGTNAAATEAQPYYSAATGTLGGAQTGVNPVNQLATGLAAGSAEQVNPTDLDSAAINKYMSPYLQDVVGSEAAVLNQNNQQQQAGQLGNAITSGAFGGDRTGIAAANLEQQQNLANASIYSGLLNTGYNTALSTAQQQQGVGLAAGQANRAALGSAAQTLSGVGNTTYGEGANTAAELGSLGTGAQTAGLSGAQAQIAAGTVQQQTQQAQDTALYNQFLQQQSYPFQVDQFLANIAEGTGALSGSTTTTTQPGGFFSDERLKEDMEVIGKTFDGQPIYRYKMKGDPREQIGLSAQKVEKKHPDAVGLAGGYRFVNYGKATEDAANRGHFYSGGVVPIRRMYAYGGSPGDAGGLGAVLEAQQNMYAPHGQSQRDIAGPAASHQLAVASGTPAPPPSGSNTAQQVVGLGKDAYQGYKWATKPKTPVNTPASGVNPGNTSGAPAPSTTGTGVTTNFEGGLDPGSGTTTTFDAGLETAPTADTAGLGAADTSAAGTGAADAAATGAAGAGAADAAGTAAVAGATDAAATEAAALAAEYAAADVATAAVLAAKRGGSVKSSDALRRLTTPYDGERRHYDAGGTPYQTDGEQIDIPDEQTSVHLQTAGPIVKQPTGLQTAMKMGDPNQASSIMGSMFSNQGLARGGVAGRRGFDDGGAPEDDAVAAPTDTAPVIASDSDRSAGLVPASKPSLWDKIKSGATAENVIPILTGLAAMGTAPTRSAGVALASGLGAGAQSYLGTRASLAKTAEEQQTAKALDIANQRAALQLGVAQKALAPQSSAGVPRQAGSASQQGAPATSTPDAAQTATGLAAQYRNQFFVNTARSPEEQAAKDAAIQKDWAVGGTMFQSQADNDYQARVQRDQNNAHNTAQQMADARYAQYNDPAASPTDKQVALSHYNALRQWTGDDQDIQGGVVKNKRTGLPEIGTIAQQGFTPAEQAGVMARARELVNVPNSDGTVTQKEAWIAHHAPSPEAYAQTLMPNSTAPPLVPTRVPPQVRAAPAAAPPSASVTQGTTQSPIALRQQQINLDALEHVREAGDQAPNNRNINQQLLQLSAATATGPATATLQKMRAVMGLPAGSRYQEINAYLDRQAASQATAMGVPHTNAGLAASQTATGTTEYTPQALQEKVKYADALNSGTMAYREGLDKAIGTGGTQNLQNYQPFRSAWARNFDPDIYRAEDAQRRGDTAELNSIRARLGSRGMKILAQKSANLRALENGQIPP